jgi:ribonucleoside-diphosphate reductase alpha chain
MSANRLDYLWLNDVSRQYLARDYLLTGQTGESRVDDIGEAAESILGVSGFAKRFVRYMKRGWFSLASPIWTNFGCARGLPISCFGSVSIDSMKSILQTHTEIGMMSKYGGGTSVFMGNIRGRGSEIKDNGTSNGSVHFAQLFDLLITVVSQGSSRRGQCAAYWPIDHADIHEVLEIRHPGSKIQALSYGICVPDKWLNEMISGDAKRREVWAKVIASRKATGYPYIFFVDTANRNAPKEYAKFGLSIKHSNLCSEISLSNNEDESFVCCLSSLNDLYFDEWERDPEAVETIIYFLDAVMSDFIAKARDKHGMERAVRFAERHRSLGLGRLGWHSCLQSKNLPFESAAAAGLNIKITKTIRDRALAASQKMATSHGEPYYLKGSGRRHMTLMAIAPTQSSSAILGQVSEGIEPYASNYIVKDKQKLKYTVRNPYLKIRLAELGMDDEAVWYSILQNGGSVQHLERLSERDKQVFKTFGEIAPMAVVRQAADRQAYIDQGQSLNLWIDPRVTPRDVNKIILEGWRLGLKSFYYQKNENAAQQLARDIMTCTACEG